MRRNSLKAAALLVLLLALGIGVTRLLQWRYSRGDVYPPYSTLRSDPLGARLLMDGLEPIESLRVRRNTGRLERLWDEPRTTIFLLGVGPDLLSMEATADDLELLALVRHGARAVIAARPEAWTLPEDEDEVKATGRPHDRRVERPDGGEDKEGTGKKQPETPLPGEESSPVTKQKPFQTLMGFKTEYLPLPRDEEKNAKVDEARLAEGAGAGLDLPETLPWHTTLCFTGLASDWRVVYVRGGRPVLIERDLGRGSMVLSADSFVLSNEALSLDPRAPLVSWLLGANRTIVFDETHLGVEERPGVATLMGRYRLHGFVAAVLLAVALFVWRASAAFVPARPVAGDEGGGDIISGSDAAAGLTALLRRGIPRSEVLRVCRSTWRKSFQKRRPDLVAALDARKEEASDPVEGYRRISRTLREMKVDYER